MWKCRQLIIYYFNFFIAAAVKFIGLFILNLFLAIFSTEASVFASATDVDFLIQLLNNIKVYC